MSDDRTILAVLQELLVWTRASSFADVGRALERALPDAQCKLAYQLTDGTRTQEQVREQCKMRRERVKAVWQRCVAMGLMADGDNGRRRRLFDLDDFGIEYHVASGAERGADE